MGLLAPAPSERAFGPQGVDIFATCFVYHWYTFVSAGGMGHGAIGARRERNSYVRSLSGYCYTITKTLNHGTNAMDSSIHPLDPFGIVWSTSCGGNRVRSYSPKEGFAKDGGYLSLIQYGTVAFPGQVPALRDGRFVVTPTKYNFVLVGEGY